MPIKHWMIWRKHLTWKLILVNALVIAVVIWLAGVSVKDFACLIVGQYEFVDEEKSRFFNKTMHFYLLRASFLAILVAAIVHYVFIRKLLSPLIALRKSTQQLIEGKYPEALNVRTSDEIGQLTEHFNELTKTLKQSEAHRNRLLTNISHELRTPLSNLHGYLEALSNGVIQGDTSLYHSLLEESHRMTRLVDQIHELTVWEAKRKHEIKMERFEIKDVIMRSVQSFELECNRQGIQVSASIEPCTLYGEESALRQVIDNLIKNAMIYDTGKNISIKSKILENKYRIMITNLGQPIPQEAARLVFERFYRVDSSRIREEGSSGTGIGLAIVKEIVEQHDGQVGLETDGVEHTFWVELPLI